MQTDVIVSYFVKNVNSFTTFYAYGKQ